MKLSVVIPAHNEEGCIESTLLAFHAKLIEEEIPFEIVVVNDNSTDDTETILKRLSRKKGIRYINNVPPNGFGFAIRKGLESFKGDAVATVMADASDSPEDLVRYYRKMEEGFDCVFGTRWSQGGRTYDYPPVKKVLNRIFNTMIQVIMQLPYNDVTNAFKLYRKEVIQGVAPLLSSHYNLTVEIPLKAIIRGYSYAVVSNSWTNRTAGVSKLKLKEMGSRYLFILLYCLIEKWLSCKDYYRDRVQENELDATSDTDNTKTNPTT
ncbi:glycosyltransferase family 2 protein [Verrucomicrobia bacterium]|nr:glycosyltransferase family 2 protein [Verrucomicrobiota bacterium]